MTSNYLQKMKKKRQLYTHSEHIQSGHRNGIWHRKMCHAYYEKCQTIPEEQNGTAKSRQD